MKRHHGRLRFVKKGVKMADCGHKAAGLYISKRYDDIENFQIII